MDKTMQFLHRFAWSPVISTYSMGSRKALIQGGKAKCKVIFKPRREKCHPDLHFRLVSLAQTLLSSRSLSFLLFITAFCTWWGNISQSLPWQEVSVQTDLTHKDSKNVKTACFLFHILREFNQINGISIIISRYKDALCILHWELNKLKFPHFLSLYPIYFETVKTCKITIFLY